MFFKNPDLRGKGEVVPMTDEQMTEYVNCSQDIFTFAKWFYIVAADGEHGIILRDYQKKIVKSIVTKVPEKPNRIIMMGRQAGKTTVATLYILWYALFNESKIIAVLANKAEQAEEIMFRIRSAIEKLPMWLQQGLVKLNQSEIIFENGTRIFSAASSSSSIRGKTVDLMLVDEFAHLDEGVARGFMMSVFPTQASRPDSMLLLISTPNGMNQFYDIWQKAKAKTNSFIPIKIQWNEIEGRDEVWKERIIKDNGIQFFQQEFACLDGNETVTIAFDDGHEETIKLKDLYEMVV